MPRAKDPEHDEIEARLQQTIAEYKKRQNKDPNDNKSSIRHITKDFNILHKTLEDCLKGRVVHNQVHESLMHLTINEEKKLVHWITTFTQHDYAPRYITVHELMEIIRNRCVRGVNDDDIQFVNYDIFDKDWVPHFMSCHSQFISARWKLIEVARVKDVSVK